MAPIQIADLAEPTTRVNRRPGRRGALGRLGFRALLARPARPRAARGRCADHPPQDARRVPAGGRGPGPDVRQPVRPGDRERPAVPAKSRRRAAQLEEASQHKSQFLANMSHELRTPLNAIIGYSEMLQEEAEDLDADAFLPDLQRINAAGKHLLGLINDILDLSKIEAGRMDLFLETFEVGGARSGRRGDRPAAGREERQHAGGRLPGRPRDDARRPDQGPPDAVQPALERRQVHRPRHDQPDRASASPTTGSPSPSPTPASG